MENAEIKLKAMISENKYTQGVIQGLQRTANE
jgi:hypothetical protein